jgi:nucleoside phosphorylase
MGTSRKGQYTSPPGKATLVGRGPRPLAARRAPWLVVSAWAPELARLTRALPHLPAPIRHKLVLGTVGVGLVDAAIGTTRLAEKLRPSGIILVGTAGRYPGKVPGLEIGHVLVADQIVLLATLSRSDRAYLPEVMSRQESATPSLAAAIRKAAGVPRVSVACPLAITASLVGAKHARRQTGCMVENLEAFAAARAAASLQIPFAAVLGIANRVGPDSHREWKRHGPAAAAAACEAVLAFLFDRKR